MENIKVDLNQNELKIIVGTFLQEKWTLGDAKVILPLIERLNSLIIKEDKVIKN